MTEEDVTLEKMKLDNDLGRYGLKGTLYGTYAALAAIVAIAVAQMVTGKTVVDGWAFTALVLIIVVPIIFFGAFVFNKILSIEGKVAGNTFKTKASP